MTDLDRFSRPIGDESSYWEEPKPMCQCEECGEDLFEGEYHYEAADMVFCDKDCFIEYCTIEYDGRTKILEGKN